MDTEESVKEENRQFRKSLTQEEKDAPSYLDWSNERLGELTRLTARYLAVKTVKGYENVTVMAALFLLCSQLQESHVGVFDCELSNVTSELFPVPTNWKIKIEKIENI